MIVILLAACILLLTLCLCALCACLWVLYRIWRGGIIFPSFANAPWRDKNYYA